MSNTYTVNTTNVFFLVNRQRDMDNLHNVFTTSLSHKYGYSHIEALDNYSIQVVFAEGVTVDSTLITEITERVASYKTSSYITALETVLQSIDLKTQQLISQGVEYDGHLFSLSDHAQRNWISTKASIDTYEALNAYPVPITTLNDDTYLLLSSDHVRSFTTVMMFGVSRHLTSGRQLKAAAKAATTVAALRAVKDRRKDR